MRTIALILALVMMATIACAPKADKNDETTTTALLVLAAVAATSSQRPIGSCNFPASGSCIDYYTGWTTSQMTADCATGSGTFTSNGTSCTAASRVGSCALVGRGAGTVVSGTTATARYYSSNFTTGTAQTNCGVLSGTFTAN